MDYPKHKITNITDVANVFGRKIMRRLKYVFLLWMII